MKISGQDNTSRRESQTMDGRNWLGLFEGYHRPLRQKHNEQGKRVGDEIREVGSYR